MRMFSRLTGAELVLLFLVGLLVAFVRVVLWTRRWPSVVRLARAIPSRLPSVCMEGFSVERLAWAVRHASRLVPGSSCLTQSLALSCALTAAGYRSRVEFGVAKGSGGAFVFHAWVVHNGRVLLSMPGEVSIYTPLHALQA
ncbi:MAG: lasso peptide biosynthesis B2 protein [Acidobacteriota bacterium]